MRTLFALAVSLALAAPAWAAGTDPDLGIHDIMAPEPGTKPAKSRKPEELPRPEKSMQKKRTHKRTATRGSSVVVRPAPLPPPLQYRPQPAPGVVAQPPAVPPSILVPQ